MRWYGLAGAPGPVQHVVTPDHAGLYWYYFTVDGSDGPVYAMRGYGRPLRVLDTLGDKYQLTVYDPAVPASLLVWEALPL